MNDVVSEHVFFLESCSTYMFASKATGMLGRQWMGIYVNKNVDYKTDFANDLYVWAYNTLFSGMGKVFKDEGNGLDRTSFSKGYALYAFNLTPDLREDDHFNLTKQGSVRLVLKFHDALTENVSVIAYAEFQNVV